MDAPELTITYQNRLGYHYFPDTLHYRELDLQTWLPRLKQLGASWLVLNTDGERTAVPEPFISGLIAAGIQPILHMSMPMSASVDLLSLELLLGTYARWGIRHIVIFDRPNARSAWPSNGWTQQGLVDRFLDRYLPAANLTLRNGITPIFPPLEPGGSFWDTAFLRLSLESLERRKQTKLIDNLVLSAYAWTFGHPLDWGAGGPERWPEAHPYLTTPNGQDQRGFRICDWYQAIAKTVLQKQVPVMLFQAGMAGSPNRPQPESIDPDIAERYLGIANLCSGTITAEADQSNALLEPLSDMVMACNFWLVSAEEDSPYQSQALFDASGAPRPAGKAIMNWVEKNNDVNSSTTGGNSLSNAGNRHPIRHYLLLPNYPGGLSDWEWNIIRGFVKKHQPTVGFDMAEAVLAEQVTLIGGDKLFCENDLDHLRNTGCQIEWIRGDGISIATQLAER